MRILGDWVLETERGAAHKGLIQVYTGNGKGKTTAAWGLALRTVGQKRRAAIVQFLKSISSGERLASERLSPDLEIFGETSPYDACVSQRGSSRLREDSRANFEIARRLILSGTYDLVVLDEMNLALFYDFVSQEEMAALLHERPENVELVITGRYAPKWLVEAADLVTEMREIKHPATAGVPARKGIEY